jgi:hypothetical protein
MDDGAMPMPAPALDGSTEQRDAHDDANEADNDNVFFTRNQDIETGLEN